MKVLVYPADSAGCGYHRLIWPAQYLKEQGHDVTIVSQEDRSLELTINREEQVVDVKLPFLPDVIVLQRITHTYPAQMVSLLREKGIAVVVDIDDDLTAIHPDNPAWFGLHPKNYGTMGSDGKRILHSWNFLNTTARDATLVTVSTPNLLKKYAPHGRGVVLRNYLADHYFEAKHEDSDIVGWPASLHSHPDDPSAVGNALSRHIDEGAQFISFGDPLSTLKAFGVNHKNEDGVPQLPPNQVKVRMNINLLDWPQAIAEEIGIGIAPLSDTSFNRSKSWLKPLEMAAVGVPWIGSPVPEYEYLADGGCGIIVDKSKAWYNVLKRLRQDQKLRIEMSEAGKEVALQLKLRDNAWRYLEAWEHALKLQRS